MSGGDVHCMFVHVPKLESEYLPLGKFINVTYMPMGLLALAELTHRHGFRTEVVHLGVEWLLDRSFRITDEFDQRNIGAVGLPLYWHYQAYDVLRVAEAIKRTSPDTFVFLGGLTASYFAAEILREFPSVDAVLQGHAEGPLPVLLQELQKDRPDLARVPFLHFRRDGEVVRSPGEYYADEAGLNDLVFADFSLLRHADTYIRSFGFPLALSKEYRLDEHLKHSTMGRSFFPLCVGRGCPTRCVYCSGSSTNLARCNGRNRVLWRQPARVMDDIRRALDAGYRTMSLCFDPTPAHDGYYVALFERIRRARLPVDFYFETWGLPTRRFIRVFAETFASDGSYLAFSPDSGNEAVRKLNKGFYYSNEELREAMGLAENLGVQLDIFFSIGLAGETLGKALETRDMIAGFRERYANIRRLMTWSIQLEPGSAQYEHPERYNMVTDRHGFMDFYRAHGGPDADTYSALGYKINGYFGDERDEGGIAEFEAHLQHLKCMEFCFLSPDPRQPLRPLEARQHCLERRKMIAARRGVRAPQQIISDDHRYADAAQAMRGGLKPQRREEWV